MSIVKLPIKQFEAQKLIFSGQAKYTVVAKGRRFGLTKGASNDFIIKALKGEFQKGLWVDTVNSNINRYVERYFIPSLRKLPSNYYNWRKQDKILQILNSYIDFRSVDRPENIEGFGYDKVFLNEAGIILKNEYLWNNAIRPMLWEYEPNIVIGGTPKGKGIFHQLWLKGQDKSQDLYRSLRFTTFDNPYLSREKIEEEIKSYPEQVAAQEVYAQFLEDSGSVFRGVDQVLTSTAEKPKEGHIYVMGVDLAKYEDFTVITVYDRKNNNQVYQDRFNQIDWNFQKKKIQTVAHHYNNALVILDSTGLGDPIADDLSRAGIAIEPFRFTNISKKEIIEKLIIWIQQKEIKMLPIKETIDEFSGFVYDVTATGKISYSAPVGLHDDIVMAHALAVKALFPTIKEQKTKEPTLISEHLQKQIKIKENKNGTDVYI